jgi:hypothetical protein
VEEKGIPKSCNKPILFGCNFSFTGNKQLNLKTSTVAKSTGYKFFKLFKDNLHIAESA